VIYLINLVLKITQQTMHKHVTCNHKKETSNEI
jgi:hypothetical protein